jgi:hypothetical protein
MSHLAEHNVPASYRPRETCRTSDACVASHTPTSANTGSIHTPSAAAYRVSRLRGARHDPAGHGHSLTYTPSTTTVASQQLRCPDSAVRYRTSRVMSAHQAMELENWHGECHLTLWLRSFCVLTIAPCHCRPNRWSSRLTLRLPPSLTPVVAPACSFHGQCGLIKSIPTDTAIPERIDHRD